MAAAAATTTHLWRDRHSFAAINIEIIVIIIGGGANYTLLHRARCSIGRISSGRPIACCVNNFPIVLMMINDFAMQNPPRVSTGNQRHRWDALPLP